MKLFLRRYYPYLWKKSTYWWGLFLGVFGFFLLANAVHETYPDEFDNILGGWYTLHGKLLYTGFFTHHNPFAYWLSAFIELFSWQSFVRFRLVYSLIVFVYLLWSYYFLQKKFGKEKTSIYIPVLLLYGVGATYFWGHMLLADNLAALLLLPVFAFLVLKNFTNTKFLLSDIVTLSLLSGTAALSSMTYAYLLIVIYLYIFFTYLFENSYKIFSKQIIKIAFIIVLPYILFGFYLLITFSISDYFYQNLVFNPKFYIYNYPRPEGVSVNPIRYAIVIAQDFHNHFSSLLISVKDFNFNFPFNITLAVGNTALIIYLVFKRRYLLAFIVLLLLIYANARTNPLESSERDYQSSVYILFSFFSIVFILKQLYEEIDHTPEFAKKLVFSFLLLIVGIYSFFNTTFLLRKFAEKTYGKFMGFHPLIYDRPQLAPIVNAVVEPSDYMWIGPFEFGELFYAEGKVPSKYIILLPEFAKSPKIQQEMMSDFNKNKPVVMYFDKRYSIRGYQPEKFGQFFLDYLNQNYVTLYEFKDGNKRYVSVKPVTERVDIETKLFIRKDKVEDVIKKLFEHEYIKQSS